MTGERGQQGDRRLRDTVNTILAAGRADLCALARPHLADAYLTLHAAARYGHGDQWWPGQYVLGKPRAGTV